MESTIIGMTWKEKLGEQIRTARKGAGMTQRQLADRIGVWRQMVSRYETGSDPPSLEILSRIAGVVDLGQVEVEGIKLSLARKSEGRPRATAIQLKLPLSKERTYRKAEVQVARQEGKLRVTAVIPL